MMSESHHIAIGGQSSIRIFAILMTGRIKKIRIHNYLDLIPHVQFDEVLLIISPHRG